MDTPGPVDIGDVLAEFDGDSLGDARLDGRLRRIVAHVAAHPDESFPEQMGTVADREALYRFLANPKVTWAGVLNGHVRQTGVRMRGRPVVRIVHDTSAFRFMGERAGLGILCGGVTGFYGHVALAVAADETREPLGVVGIHPYIHQDTAAHQGMTRPQRVAASRAKPRAAKESARWEDLALQVSATLPAGVAAVHVMDQEADDYAVFAALAAAQVRYVIRVRPARRTMEATQGIDAVLAARPATVFRTVPVTARSARQARDSRAGHPARAERRAHLVVRWGSVTLHQGAYHQAACPTLTLQAVHVLEVEPPAGEAPIEWMLVTTDPVDTVDAATAVVDHYRARWLIEEYFKALKTGCAFEKRQLTSLPGLLRALALFVPLAWRLLVLRHLGRAPAPLPASHVFEADHLQLLRLLLTRRRVPLPETPTMRDVLWGIAALGGHITNNGAPGWQVLGRGFTKFLDAHVGWRLAREKM